MNLNLLPFCSFERTQLLRPWSHGPWTYATDGRILIRVDRQPDVPEPAPDDLPCQPEPLLDYNWPGSVDRTGRMAMTPTPLPAVDVSETNPCPHCKGSGTEPPAMKCKECNGEGMVECHHCHHEADCDRCNKTGWIDVPEGTPGAVIDPCETCGGKKTIPAKSHVKLGSQHIATGYYQLLATLPDVRFTNHGGDPDYNPIPFTFTGGVGVLMPFRVG